MAGDHQRHIADVRADDRTVTRIARQLAYAPSGIGGNPFNVGWDYFEKKSGERVEIALINGISNRNQLKVSGGVNTSELRSDVMYEVVFVVMLKNDATMRDVQMKFKVELPDGIGMPAEPKRTENLVSKAKQQWMEILAGEFKTIPNMNLESMINFSLDIESVQVPQESGLVIESVIFRPVRTPLNPIPIQTMEINVRELSIYRGHQKHHWTWDVIQDGTIGSNNTPKFIEVVQNVEIIWFEVIGKYDASRLTPGFTYEVVFYIRLKEDAQNWENNPVTTRINGRDCSTQFIYSSTYQTSEFKALIAGDITVDQQTMSRGIKFSLSETTSGQSKKGLVIKRVVLRQKENPST